MKQDITTEVTFRITNVGTEPLLVYHIQTTCNCAIAQWDKTPILPNQTLNVSIFVTPDFKGFFNKNIDIYTNAEQQRMRFRIYGNVQ